MPEINTVLKLSLAAAALMAGAGVGYYYGIHLPAQDLRRQTREMNERQAREAQQARALAERARREEAAQTEYADCVNFSELAYRQRWTQSCQSLHDADQSAFEDCADDLFSTERGCLAKRPIRPARDCALPAGMAQALTEAREQRKAQCLARLESLQHGGNGAVAVEASGAALAE